MTSVSSQSMNQQKNFQHYIGVVTRRKWFIIIPVIASFVISVILCFITPNEYESQSMILIDKTRIVDPLVSEIAVSPNMQDELNKLAKKVLAFDHLNQLVSDLNLAENRSSQEVEKYILQLQKRVDISMAEDDLLEISYIDKKAIVSQYVVDRLTKSFIEESIIVKKEEAKNAIEFINDQLKIYRTKLGNSQKKFSASKINSELRLAINRRNILMERLENFQKFIPSSVTRSKNSVVAHLDNQMGELKADLARQMIDAKENNPRVVELKKIIREIQKKITQEQKKVIVKERISVSNPAYRQVDQELKQLEMRIEYLEERKSELEKSSRHLEKSATEEELATLERDKRVNEDIYQMLLKQLEAAYVSERLQNSENGSRFTIVEEARLPMQPVRPDKLNIILVGLLIGCGTGLGLAFLLEYFDKSFMSIEDAERFLPLPVLGTISKMVLPDPNPNLVKSYQNKLEKKYKFFTQFEFLKPHFIKKHKSSKISDHIVMYHEPQSKIAEEYRILRTNILGHNQEKTLKTFLITSTIKGEGKSVTAANLAVAMAYSGKNTLLVDCDLRKGTLHKLFGIQQSPGLIDVLNSTDEINNALKNKIIKNLTVMPNGGLPDNPTELLSSNKIKSLLAYMEKYFDLIILDSPPVLNLSDTFILGKYADYALLLVQMEKTQRESVISMQNALKRSNIDVAGYILTKMHYYMQRSLYGYYSNYSNSDKVN